MSAYWQHRIKCLRCGLHFIVCSDYEGWPFEGTTGEATGLIHCPECGSAGPKLVAKVKVSGFIAQAVPGDADFQGIHGPAIAGEGE
jgi:DNA-directed RNA polymerase subunit RPC12/RpoP